MLDEGRRARRGNEPLVAARDVHGTAPPWGDSFDVIGRPHRKVDGMAKATGAAVYADDITLPGMLHARTLRSPHPHARIVSIDTSRAEALEGVQDRKSVV